jgi:hypothetical protein
MLAHFSTFVKFISSWRNDVSSCLEVKIEASEKLLHHLDYACLIAYEIKLPYPEPIPGFEQI